MSIPSELSKYIGKMPMTNPSEKDQEITLKRLSLYNKSLKCGC